MAQDYQSDEERSLSRTFFVLSIILVIASLYTVVDETFVRRPWKHYQTTFYELEYDQLRADLQAKEEVLLPTQGELATKIQQAQAALESNAQYRKAREEMERVRTRLDALQAEIKAAEAPLYELEEERRIRLSDYQRIRERMNDIMRPVLPGIRVPKPPEIEQVVLT